MTNDLKIEQCTKADFYSILENIEEFWGSDRTLIYHHPMFIYEFGNSAFVIKENNSVIAYLLGFISQTEPTGYIHMAGVSQTHQQKGLGKQLYSHFINYAKAKNCNKIKAITTSTNKGSIAFHKKLGMRLLGESNGEGVPVIKDYSGKGKDRVVFNLDI